MRAPYVVIEGMDCAGKDTLADALNRRFPGVVLREPAAESRTRRLLSMPPVGAWTPEAWIASFVADMLEQQGTYPRLTTPVYCVRRELSTLAYQVPRCASPTAAAAFLREATAPLPRPDLTIVLLGDPRVLLARGWNRAADNSANETLVRQREVEAAYRTACGVYAVWGRGPVHIFDAVQSPTEIVTQAIEAIRLECKP